MTLEEFEKLISSNQYGGEKKEKSGPDRSDKRRKHRHRHRNHDDDNDDRHRHKRSRDVTASHVRGDNERPTKGLNNQELLHDYQANDDEWVEKETVNAASSTNPQPELKRDSWMEGPSQTLVEFVQKSSSHDTGSMTTGSARQESELKIHKNELNKHHLRDLANGKGWTIEPVHDGTDRVVDYTFGDAGAPWRMTKLKAVFREAEETSKPVDEVAIERFGDLRAFDDAREEQLELERRDIYGNDYLGKEKPTGKLFQERELDLKSHNHSGLSLAGNKRSPDHEALLLREPDPSHPIIDQTTLNKMKARMMKARLRGESDAPALEAAYAKAVALFEDRQEPELVVLHAMESRMLAGGRKGEVKSINNKRGHERGLVEENEDMTIEAMVRQEKRTRHEAGGDGQRFAERIAKDGKFDNNLDYMDENANKLAKRVQRSEINLKNTAISDFQKMNRILDNCPLCHREDQNIPPIAPLVSLATRVYLTLPTEPEIADGGACIVPLQHRVNLLECDDDEWEEIRVSLDRLLGLRSLLTFLWNFMKCLTRMYHDQGRDVIFYENAAVPQRKKHAAMEVVPLPYSLGETAPAFFKEAILSSDEEWAHHKKIIDTLSKAKQGQGKSAFRQTLIKEMPYFHVWFELDGGLGHIVEDTNRWPRGDLFAREIIGGMLDREPEVIRKQGRWSKGSDGRVEAFRKRWKKFDWTRVLTDG